MTGDTRHDGRVRRAAREEETEDYAESLDGLDVVRVDANAGHGHAADAVFSTVEVWSQTLDDQLLLGQTAKRFDRFCDVRSAEIWKIVAIHAG